MPDPGTGVRQRVAPALLASVLALGLLAGCSGGADPTPFGAAASSSPTTTAASDVPTGIATLAAADTAGSTGDASAYADPADAATDKALDAAVSSPREDSVYPDVGDPSVDALHYDLDLAWTPSTRTLDGVATISFRAPTAADHVQLDLAESLAVSSATLDGQPVQVEHPGKDLVVESPVTADSRHLLVVTYSGVPEPAAAPTTRSDVATVGWTTTDAGAAWTMQEPYGAYTWYPVDDHPADKAFYDITVTTPAPFVGIAGGEQTASTTHDGLTTTSWHLDTPASSYLVTVAVGDYEKTQNTSASGVPITYWVPRGAARSLTRDVHQADDALDWVEDKLGPYPFSSLGFVLVASTSGMETQSLITLGSSEYDVSEATLVHELAHQWYGDEVTPSDWSDLWMNEGMAMYLQLMWQAEQDGVTMAAELAPVVEEEAELRAEDGPPGAYDPSRFAESNVYYGPALMWQALRQRIGDAAFFAVIKAWPATHPDTSQSRDTFLPWLVEQTGVPRSFFENWLTSPTSPRLDLS